MMETAVHPHAGSAGRALARELTCEEIQRVSGASDTFTVYCTEPGKIDEDCEVVTDCN